MQHRYVPDLGDFSKFVVIDALSGRGQLRTALIWYLVDPHEVGDAHNNDGKHTTYLHDDRQGFADCHPELYQRFQAIYAGGEKHVGVYEKHGVLNNTAYFAEPISYSGQGVAQRVPWRAGWLSRAVTLADQSDLVVLDPDNGLKSDRVSIRSKNAVKFATLDECAAFYDQGRRSLVVYQHAHRQASATQQANRALERISESLGVARRDTFALRFHRGTTRFYLVVPATQQAQTLHQRALSLVNRAWGQRGHFSMID